MVYASLNSEGGGAKRKGARGNDIGTDGYHGGEEERAWGHTMEGALTARLSGALHNVTDVCLSSS